MLDNYSGATRIFPLVGNPIAQVRSPKGLTRAFETAGHDGIVVPIQVSAEDVQDALAMFGRLRNVDGMLATVPHKFAAFRHATASSERARILGSANVLRRTPDGWFADMLDGVSFVLGIEAAGCRVAGSRCLLVGAGGAGSAIGLELLNAGVDHLAVHDADADRRDSLLNKLAAVHPGRTSVGSPDPTGFTLIVNSTPSGMNEADVPPVMLDRLEAAMFVGDVITVPEITPLLRAARMKGCLTQTGAGMHDASIALMRDFFFEPR